MPHIKNYSYLKKSIKTCVYSVLLAVTVLFSSNSAYSAGKCDGFFIQSASRLDGFQNITYGSLLKAIQALKNVQDDRVDPSVDYRLPSMTAAISKAQVRNNDITALARALDVDVSDLTRIELTPEYIFNLVDRLSFNQMQQVAREVDKNKNNGFRQHQAFVRLQELHRLKFLAFLLNPFPLVENSAFKDYELVIGPGIEKYFTYAYMRHQQLNDIIKKVNVASEFFTDRDFFSFFNLLENRQYAHHYTTVIPLFVPKTLTSETNWNYVVELVSYLNKEKKKHENFSVSELSKQINIDPIPLDLILNHGVKPEGLALDRLSNWVKLQVKSVRQISADPLPKHVDSRPIYSFTGVHGEDFRVFFKTDEKLKGFESLITESEPLSNPTPDVRSTEANGTLERRLTEDENPYPESYFEKYIDPDINFGDAVQSKMEQATGMFGLGNIAIRNRFEITTQMWNFWTATDEKPASRESNKKLAAFLIAIENNKLPEKPANTKSTKTQTKKTMQREGYGHGEVVQVSLDHYAQVHHVEISDKPLLVTRISKQEAKFKNLPFKKIIEHLRKKRGFKTVAAAVEQAHKDNFSNSAKTWYNLENGEVITPNPETFKMLAKVLDIDQKQLEKYFRQSIITASKELNESQIYAFLKSDRTAGAKTKKIRELRGYISIKQAVRSGEAIAKELKLNVSGLYNKWYRLETEGFVKFADPHVKDVIAKTLELEAVDLFKVANSVVVKDTFKLKAEKAFAADFEKYNALSISEVEQLPIHERIKAYRIRKKLTIEMVAAQLEQSEAYTVSIQTWVRIEDGITKQPSSKVTKSIAEVLDLNAEHLKIDFKSAAIKSKNYNFEDTVEVQGILANPLLAPSQKVTQIRLERKFLSINEAVEYSKQLVDEKSGLIPVDYQKWWKFEVKGIKFRDINAYLLIAKTLNVNAKDLFGDLLNKKVASPVKSSAKNKEPIDKYRNMTEEELSNLSPGELIKALRFRLGLYTVEAVLNKAAEEGIEGIAPLTWNNIENNITTQPHKRLLNAIHKVTGKSLPFVEKLYFDISKVFIRSKKVSDKIEVVLNKSSLNPGQKTMQIRILRGLTSPKVAIQYYNFKRNSQTTPSLAQHHWVSLEDKGTKKFRDNQIQIDIAETLEVDPARLFADPVAKNVAPSITTVLKKKFEAEYKLYNNMNKKQRAQLPAREQVRALRVLAGFESPEAAAEVAQNYKDISISGASWRNVEDGITKSPRGKTLQAIATVLRKKPQELIDLYKSTEAFKPSTSKQTRAALRKILADPTLSPGKRVLSIRNALGFKSVHDAVTYGKGLSEAGTYSGTIETQWSRLEREGKVKLRDKRTYFFIATTLNINAKKLFPNLLN